MTPLSRYPSGAQPAPDASHFASGPTEDSHRLRGRVDRLDVQVGKIEVAIERLQEDVKELRQDVKAIRTTDFRLIFGTIIGLALGFAGLMAKGFHWI